MASTRNLSVRSHRAAHQSSAVLLLLLNFSLFLIFHLVNSLRSLPSQNRFVFFFKTSRSLLRNWRNRTYICWKFIESRMKQKALALLRLNVGENAGKMSNCFVWFIQELREKQLVECVTVQQDGSISTIFCFDFVLFYFGFLVVLASICYSARFETNTLDKRWLVLLFYILRLVHRPERMKMRPLIHNPIIHVNIPSVLYHLNSGSCGQRSRPLIRKALQFSKSLTTSCLKQTEEIGIGSFFFSLKCREDSRVQNPLHSYAFLFSEMSVKEHLLV